MGHPPADVWAYTPKQIAGFLHFAGRRRRAEMAELLSLHAMAARGDPKEMKKFHKDLMKD